MKYLPHRYQEYCINRVINDENLGLFLDMGLGKSVITLSAIRELRFNRFAVRKILIVAPKKVAEATWVQEAEKWDHTKGLKLSLVLGTEKQRVAALYAKADVYVINRENVVWLVEFYRERWPFDMVVLDESSSFKSHKAKRFKALTYVRPHIKRMLLLTGTPSPNGLSDLWSQIYLLDGGERLEKRYTQFRSRYFEPDKRSRDIIYSYAPVKGAEELILKKISDVCVSMQASDYLQLPDLVMDTVPVVLDPRARKAYTELEREMLLEVAPETIVDVASAAALSNKLLQLSNGAVYDSDRGVHEIHRCKIDAFLELLEGLNGKPALVFYQYQHDLSRIQEALSKLKLRVRILKTVADQEAWNRREVDVLLAHPASAAYGLNLQEGGNHIVWFGLSWNLEQYQQANARLHRQGQKEKVIVHHLVTQDSRDVDVIAALEYKGDVQDFLMKSLKARIKAVAQKGD